MVERTSLFLAIGMAASVLLALGLVMMKSRGNELEPAHGRGVLKALRGWFKDPVWLGGLGVQIVGYALYIVALTGAPVSMLAVMMQGGIAVFVLITMVFLNEHASGREWLGIVGVVVAMTLLSLTLGSGTESNRADSRSLTITSIGAIAVALLPYANSRLRDGGLASALASGIIFGLASLFAKAVTEIFDASGSRPLISSLLTSPWLYLAIIANLSGMVLLQNAFHWARGIIAMPLSSAGSNLVPIVGGMLAFGERLPSATGPAAMRVTAFTLTIVSGGLLATGKD